MGRVTETQVEKSTTVGLTYLNLKLKFTRIQFSVEDVPKVGQRR